MEYEPTGSAVFNPHSAAELRLVVNSVASASGYKYS